MSTKNSIFPFDPLYILFFIYKAKNKI